MTEDPRREGHQAPLERSQPPAWSQGSIREKAVFWIGAWVALAHVYFNTIGTLPELWTSAMHFAGFGLMCALIHPLAPRKPRESLDLDVIIGVLVVAVVAYLILAEDAFYARGSNFNSADWIFSALGVVLAIEFTRRATGWFIPVLIVVALAYVVWWGDWVGGMFHFPGLSAEIVLFRQYLGADGMFGPIARISSTFVFMFILFGAFLVRSGAGDFIIDLARCAAGRLVGGPGLVAVFGSALMGSISGSAVANTVSTGVITIPLMRRAGFSPRFAAGVEAAASTGGQLMPPVMGAGAFVMSSYTQIPYLKIIAVAALPALMYFLSVAMWVRIEAMKRGLRPAPAAAAALREVVRKGGHYLIPIVVLVAMLVAGFTPTYAAGFGILSVIAASWLSPRKMGPVAILEALAQGARNMVATAMLLVAVGIIVNVVATTGIGNTFSLMITSWAGGNLLVTIVLIALASLVLGMGLPVTAAYIVLATLSAPAIYDLITHAQVVEAIVAGQVPAAAAAAIALAAPDQAAALGAPMPPAEAAALAALIPWDLFHAVSEQTLEPAALTAALLSAHMVIYWLSQDSNVTPPVCLTAFAAAAIAKTPPMGTGLMAWKIAKGLYIVPVLIAFTPLLGSAPLEVAEIFVFGVCGIYALNGALDGHLEAPVDWPYRALLAAAGLALLWPNASLFHCAGLTLLAAVLVPNLRASRAAAKATTSAGDGDRKTADRNEPRGTLLMTPNREANGAVSSAETNPDRQNTRPASHTAPATGRGAEMGYDPNNIFARILRGEIPNDTVYEDDHVLAFRDLNPQAPTHVLVIPKGAYVSLDDFSQNASEAEIAALIRAVGQVARDLGATDDGYRILANHGPNANQEVPHLHIHIFAGRPLGPMLVRG